MQTERTLTKKIKELHNSIYKAEHQRLIDADKLFKWSQVLPLHCRLIGRQHNKDFWVLIVFVHQCIWCNIVGLLFAFWIEEIEWNIWRGFNKDPENRLFIKVWNFTKCLIRYSKKIHSTPLYYLSPQNFFTAQVSSDQTTTEFVIGILEYLKYYAGRRRFGYVVASN